MLVQNQRNNLTPNKLSMIIMSHKLYKIKSGKGLMLKDQIRLKKIKFRLFLLKLAVIYHFKDFKLIVISKFDRKLKFVNFGL